MAAKLIIGVGLLIASVVLIAEGLIKLLMSRSDLVGVAIEISAGVANFVYALILLQFHKQEREKLARTDSSKTT